MKIQLRIANTFILVALLLIPAKSTVAMVDIEAKHCAEISNNEQRLTCFDLWYKNQKNTTTGLDKNSSKIDGSISTAQSNPLITEPIVPAPIEAKDPNVAPSLEQGFGMEHKRSRPEEDIDHLIFTIKTASKNPHGKWRLTFTNGQQWGSISSDKLRLKVGQKVKISRGMFNSFSLTAENSNRSIKVKRIK